MPPLFAGIKRSIDKVEERASADLALNLKADTELFLGLDGGLRLRKTENPRKKIKTADEQHRAHPHGKRSPLGLPGRIDIMVCSFGSHASVVFERMISEQCRKQPYWRPPGFTGCGE